MGRSANGLTRKTTGAEKPAAQGSSREQDWELNLDALRQTPGFMIRILQLLNFEAFYRHFESLKLSPVEYAILIIVRALTASCATTRRGRKANSLPCARCICPTS